VGDVSFSSRRPRSRIPTSSEALSAVFNAIRNWRLLLEFTTAPPQSELSKQLAQRPEIWEMVLTPYVTAHWDAYDRLRRVKDHCDTCERLGPLLIAPWDGYLIIATLPEIGPTYRLMIEQPRWLLREGQSAMSIWDGGDRLFTISYCLSSEDDCLKAYVGGLQGVVGHDILERYRLLTKSAHGLRPPDLLVELFRIFCRSLGAECIHCVSDEIRQQRSDYYLKRNAEKIIQRRYDDVWLERGGVRQNDRFYKLSTSTPTRSERDMPPKKRGMYRRRYAMLDSIAARMSEIVNAGITSEQLLYFGQESRLPTRKEIEGCATTLQP